MLDYSTGLLNPKQIQYILNDTELTHMLIFKWSMK